MQIGLFVVNVAIILYWLDWGIIMTSAIIQDCAKHAQKAKQALFKKIQANGKLADYPDDLVCYYKLPYLLTISGEAILANRVLDYMKATFFTENNTVTFNNKKTNNPLMAKFWGYVLGWVTLAAQKLGRFDLSYPAFEYLSKFQSQDHGGFATSDQWGLSDDAMDIITSAQLGRLSLYFGQTRQAFNAGQFLSWNINNQPNIEESMFLFVDNHKKQVQNFPQDLTFIYELKKHEPNQAYFMIGLPCAFLVELYQATHQQTFLTAAKQYADFALACHETIKQFHFSHKVAWAMSLLYKTTQEEKYLTLSKAISTYLMNIQSDDGFWLKDQNPIDSLDQTVENAIWLNEIAVNLA